MLRNVLIISLAIMPAAVCAQQPLYEPSPNSQYKVPQAQGGSATGQKHGTSKTPSQSAKKGFDSASSKPVSGKSSPSSSGNHTQKLSVSQQRIEKEAIAKALHQNGSSATTPSMRNPGTAKSDLESAAIKSMYASEAESYATLKRTREQRLVAEKKAAERPIEPSGIQVSTELPPGWDSKSGQANESAAHKACIERFQASLGPHTTLRATNGPLPCENVP